MIYYEEKITLFRTTYISKVIGPGGGEQSGFATSIDKVLANVARFKVEAGSIETLDIWTDAPSAGLKRFTLLINGVNQFPVVGDQMDLAAGSHVGKTGLSIDVDDGDTVSFDLNAIEGSITAPLYFRIGLVGTGGGGIIVLDYALSDETTNLTVGTAKLKSRVPCDFDVLDIRSSLSDDSSSGLVTVDVNIAGSSVLSTKLSIDAGETTSVTAAAARVISDLSWNDNDEMVFDIDAAGTGAKGLKVQILGYQRV